jgi:lambda family phage portal protein
MLRYLKQLLTRPAPLPMVSVLDLRPAPFRMAFDDGDKWRGGFGPTELLFRDYWTLRQRSIQLFETNLYARGLIRRLITNEIHTGLHLEASPEEAILGLEEDALADWSENVENRFALWGADPRLCDQTQLRTFGALQAVARLEALVAGDVLVVLRQDSRTKLPRLQLTSGTAVQSPLGVTVNAGSQIRNGVEIDSQGRHVAYWIAQREGTSAIPKSVRLPAYGEKSGRRLAWLVYGDDKRLDEETRGKPLLAIVLQSLKEIDRYRDSVQRKAIVNSLYAVFIKRLETKLSARSLTGAQRSLASLPGTPAPGPRHFDITERPGIVIDDLAPGEEPVPFNSNGTDEKFGDFEDAIVQAIAWHFEIPPEILKLSFGTNYAASQAAINEFKMKLNRSRADFGDQFCQPVYEDWLISQVLSGRIKANGLLEAWSDPLQYDTFGAWLSADWTGNIKPAVDFSKLVRGYSEGIAGGFITRDRAARELTGTKFSKNVQKLARETRLLFEAVKPISELKALEKAQAPEPQGAPADERPPADDPINEEADASALARRALRPIAGGAAASAD